MTDKELRRLSRSQLLEMLITQTQENQRLRQQLEQAQQALSDRQIHLACAGSIAEAALRLNDVFEAADKAAQQYLASVKALAEEQQP